MTGFDKPEYIEQCDLLMKEAVNLLSEIMTSKDNLFRYIRQTERKH